MIEKIITYGLITFVVTLSLTYLTKLTGKKVTADLNGKIELRMNKLYVIVGLISMIMGIGFALVFAFIGEFDRGSIIGLVIMLVFGLGLGLPCLIYYQNHRILFDNQSIQATDGLNKTEKIKWDDIKSIRFNHFSGKLTIKDTSKIIKLHQHLVGLSTFMKMLEERTKWTAEELKIPIEK